MTVEPATLILGILFAVSEVLAIVDKVAPNSMLEAVMAGINGVLGRIPHVAISKVNPSAIIPDVPNAILPMKGNYDTVVNISPLETYEIQSVESKIITSLIEGKGSVEFTHLSKCAHDILIAQKYQVEFNPEDNSSTIVLF